MSQSIPFSSYKNSTPSTQTPWSCFRCSPQGALGGFLPSMLMPQNTGTRDSSKSSTWYMRWVIPLEGVVGKGDSELCLEGHPAWRLSYHLLSWENEQDANPLLGL